YQPLFKRPLSQQDIVDELLHYDDVLRTGYDTVQYLKYAFSHREHTLFFEYLQQLDNQLPHWFKKKLLFFNKVLLFTTIKSLIRMFYPYQT
ncbi:hypothetical protein JZO84_09850, partial [Enterococcus plantarum]|nr:hypothetical protein [Enterococcus plantarum]